MRFSKKEESAPIENISEIEPLKVEDLFKKEGFGEFIIKYAEHGKLEFKKNKKGKEAATPESQKAAQEEAESLTTDEAREDEVMKLYRTFEASNRLKSVVPELYATGIKEDTGFELPNEAKIALQKYFEDEAIKNPDTLMAWNEHYDSYNRIREDVLSKENELKNLLDMPDVSLESLEKSKEEISLREDKIVKMLSEREEKNKVVEWFKSWFGRGAYNEEYMQHSVAEWDNKLKNLQEQSGAVTSVAELQKKFKGLRQTFLDTAFSPAQLIQAFARKKIQGKLKENFDKSKSLEELEVVQEEIDNLTELRQQGRFDYLENIVKGGEEEFQKKLDKAIDGRVEIDIREAITKTKNPFVDLENALKPFLEKFVLGSKNEKEVKKFIYETIAKVKDNQKTEKIKKLALAMLLKKLEPNLVVGGNEVELIGVGTKSVETEVDKELKELASKMATKPQPSEEEAGILEEVESKFLTDRVGRVGSEYTRLTGELYTKAKPEDIFNIKTYLNLIKLNKDLREALKDKNWAGKVDLLNKYIEAYEAANKLLQELVNNPKKISETIDAAKDADREAQKNSKRKKRAENKNLKKVKIKRGRK